MAELKLEIQAANVKFMEAFARQDANAVGALYTDDCKVMPTGTDVINGPGGAASVFDSVMKAGATRVLLTIDEVGPMGGGDVAYERSHYTFYKSDGSVFDHGKYVVIWKKDDGNWKLYIDIFNSNKTPSN